MPEPEKDHSARRSSAILALFIGALAISSAPLLIRFAQQYSPSIMVAAFRMIFAATILAPFSLSRRGKEITGLKNRSLLLLVLSGLFLGVHFAAWVTALEYATVASGSVFVATSPLWVAILSPVFLREKPSRAVLIGIGIAFAGGVIVALGGMDSGLNLGLLFSDRSGGAGGQAMLGNLLALLAAWLGAGYLLVGRWARPRFSLLTYTFVVYSIAAVILLVWSLAAGIQLLGYPLPAYLWCLALAVIPQLMGHSSVNFALRDLPATLVSTAILATPAISTVLAYLLLDEVPAVQEIIGGVVILGGVYLALQAEEEQDSQPTPD